jgi:hypothetical protein
MAEASGRLQALLSGGLRDALKTGNVSARTYCLQAYAAVGDTSGAEEVGSLYICLSTCVWIYMHVHGSFQTSYFLWYSLLHFHSGCFTDGMVDNNRHVVDKDMCVGFLPSRVFAH